MFPRNSLPESEKMKEIWTLVASLMGLMAMSQALLHPLLPWLHLLFQLVSKILFSNSSYCYFDINDTDGGNTNELYNDVLLYLSSTLSVSRHDTAAAVASRLTLTRAPKSSTITFGLSTDDHIVDTYKNIPLRWQHVVSEHQSHSGSGNSNTPPIEKRRFTLRFRKRDRALILDSYLDHIKRTATDISHKNKGRLLYTNSNSYPFERDGWQSVPFNHPSTFDTLAMDPDKKEEIMNDLKDFACGGQSFYQKTGRAWKRGYLLHGPPGTGKTSMIAAMANFLSYDIYYLELTHVDDNTELQKLLMRTSSKSIIVIEDIDCSINLTNRNSDKKIGGKKKKLLETIKEEVRTGSNKITLSGLLNFTDGLWSCCGSERIFVFTTNYVEKLDPGLLRSGRMDVHILMSYCSFESLKILLKNYLDCTEDDLSAPVWDELEQLMDKARMTPAEVGEHLIKHKRNKAKAVQELIKTMRLKAEGKAGAEAKWTEQGKPESVLGVEEEDIGITQLFG